MSGMRQADAADAQGGGRWRAVGWALVAWLALLVAFATNGRPLFYFDTAGYFAAGDNMLRAIGLFAPEATGGSAGGPASAPDGSVTGSRSAVYAVLAATLEQLGALRVLVLLQAAALVLVLHLASRAVMAHVGHPARAWPATAAATLAGVLGSAGFYTASLMPDIFAPVLLVAIAGLAAFAPDLRRTPALVFLVLAAAAVVMHPSHLAIALLAVPGVALACLAFGTRRWWLSVLLVALIPVVGLVERWAFTVTVESTTGDDVTYLPFFTARLIADGPGKAYLDATCPAVGPAAGESADGAAVTAADPAAAPAASPNAAPNAAPVMATCALNAMLVRPEQLSPERILFATDPAIGSFALLDPATRRDISAEQRAFLQAVLTARPLDVVAAALGNTFTQLGLVSIDMTLPDAQTLRSAREIDPNFPDSLVVGRLTRGDDPGADWVAVLTRFHQVYYALAALALVALLVLPQSRLPRQVRLFGVLVLLGILANAFVTGAISQPANRYGARVIFLVPAVLVLLALARPARETRR